MKHKDARQTEALLDRLMGAGMIVMGTAGLVMSASSLAGLSLPTWLVGLLGALSLAGLPLAVYGTVKKSRLKKAAPEAKKAPGGKRKKKKKK